MNSPDEDADTDFTQFDALLAKHGFGDTRSASYVDRGWWPILDEALKRLRAAGVIEIGEIKEKFGELTVYLGDVDPDADSRVLAGIISEAVLASRITCEECGQLGKMRSGGWYKVRCDEHQKIQEAMHSVQKE